MNVGSLFTGVGGFDLGLERAGHNIVFQCEADAKCRQVLQRHWPEVPIYEDVREVAQSGEQRGLGQMDRKRNLSDPKSNGSSAHGESKHVGSDLRSVGLSKSRGEFGSSDDGAEHGNGNGSSGSDLSINLLCGGFPCQDLSVAGKRAGLAGERSGLFYEFMRIADALLGAGDWVLIENVPGLFSSTGGRDFGIVLSTLAELGFYDLAWRVLDSRYFGVPQRRRRVFVLARRAGGRRSAQVLLEPESGGGNFTAGRKAGSGIATASGSRIANALDGQRGGADDNAAQANHLVANTLQTTAGDYSRADGFNMVLSTPPNPDRVREASGIPGRVDGAVTAFHATQTPISSDDHSPALGSNAQIGVSGNGLETEKCAVDPKPDGPRYAQMGNAVTVQVAEWIGYRLARFGGEE